MKNKNLIILQLSGEELENLITKCLKKLLDDRGVKEPLNKNSYVTRVEAAEFLNISLVTLHHWTRQGLIKPYKISSRVRYKLSELVDFINGLNNKLENQE